MVIINLKGGLGNQLFQYSAAFAVAKSRNQKLAFDTHSFQHDKCGRKYALTPFRVDGTFYSKKEVESFLNLSFFNRLINYFRPKKSKHYLSLGHLESDFCILNTKPRNQYLNGYFANPQYFERIRSEILINITLKKEYETDLFKQILEWIRTNKFISVHIRRSDYISDQVANQLFETLSMEYYFSSIDYFKKNVETPNKFLFFSDDLDWVKNEFKHLEDAHFIDEKKLYKDYYDIMFMAACEHNIIANSTFSWWGAWLNKNPHKVVIAPRKWYKNAAYQQFYEKTNFVPKSWIKL